MGYLIDFKVLDVYYIPVGKSRCFDVDVTSEYDVVWMLSVGLE